MIRKQIREIVQGDEVKSTYFVRSLIFTEFWNLNRSRKNGYEEIRESKYSRGIERRNFRPENFDEWFVIEYYKNAEIFLVKFKYSFLWNLPFPLIGRSGKPSRNRSESSGSEDEKDDRGGNRLEFPVERPRGSSVESIVCDSDYQRWCECAIIILFNEWIIDCLSTSYWIFNFFWQMRRTFDMAVSCASKISM